MADLHSEAADSLFKAILSLRSEEECYAFFEDLCTVGELQAMSQRYHVARLLRSGLVYSEVGRPTSSKIMGLEIIWLGFCITYPT